MNTDYNVSGLASPRSVAERWAELVLKTIDADRDPRTIGDWAKSAGVSRSVLSECCRMVRVSPRDARDFARLLRGLCRSGLSWQPEAVLDVADARTLNKLLARAGLPRQGVSPTPEQFVERQQWIPTSNCALSALRELLRRRAAAPTSFTTGALTGGAHTQAMRTAIAAPTLPLVEPVPIALKSRS